MAAWVFEMRVQSGSRRWLDPAAAALQVVRLRAKLTDAAGAVKGIFGIKSEKDPAVAKLEALQVQSFCHGVSNLGLLTVKFLYCV
jgi:hypothetical protein